MLLVLWLLSVLLVLSAAEEDACSAAMQQLCSLGEEFSFEQSLRCLEDHMSELKGACSGALNVMMTNLYSDCSEAVTNLCPPSTSTESDEAVYVLTSLSNHESELSADCQQQLDTYLSQEYPCAKEAAMFCKEDSSVSPQKTLRCLEDFLATSPDEISLECSAVIQEFSSCKDVDYPDNSPDNGKPEPKPKPQATSRLLGTLPESHENLLDAKPKPKPKPKPAPGELKPKPQATSRLLSTSSESSEDLQDTKPKPKAKPKPAPGDRDADRLCWTGQHLSGDQTGSSNFLGDYDTLFSSGSTRSTENDDDSHSTAGVVASSLLIVVALVGVVGVKYRQSQDNETNGGYWRAPSIQAMLFDDSAHPTDNMNDSNSFLTGESERVVMTQVVEMDDIVKGDGNPKPSVEAIQVTLSPITSDEIRV